MKDIFDDRHYVIFQTSELYLVDFRQVNEDSIHTVRKSLDLNEVVLKWESLNGVPEFIDKLTTLVGIYNHSEILKIMASLEWQNDLF